MRRWLMVILLAGTSLGLFAQEGYTILSVEILPEQYYAGDRVELKVELLHEENPEIVVPDIPQDTDPIRIHSLKLETAGDRSLLTLSFTAYAPGTRRIPSLDFGAWVLDDVKIYTHSILEDQGISELNDIQAPVLVPSTRLLFLFWGAILLGLPLLFLTLGRGGWRQGKKILARIRERKPYRRMVKTLESLHQKQYTLSASDFYSVVTDEFKIYLSARSGKDCLSATTRELSRILREDFSSTICNPLFKLFHRADMIKFASMRASVEQMEKDLGICVDLVQRIEAKGAADADVSNA